MWGLFARSIRVSVAADLTWDDLLNASPSTVVSMGEGLVRPDAKTKTRERPKEGRYWRASSYAYSKETTDGYKKATNYSKESLWGYDWGFWICQHFESEGECFTASPSLWSCASNVMAYMLDLAGRPKGHGIMPNSLKVAKNCALMTEIVKGQSNLSQLATRGELQGLHAPGRG